VIPVLLLGGPNIGIAFNPSALAALCRKWKVKRLALFGSVAELQ